jgi:hypothetical protein
MLRIIINKKLVANTNCTNAVSMEQYKVLWFLATVFLWQLLTSAKFNLAR